MFISFLNFVLMLNQTVCKIVMLVEIITAPILKTYKVLGFRDSGNLQNYEFLLEKQKHRQKQAFFDISLWERVSLFQCPESICEIFHAHNNSPCMDTVFFFPDFVLFWATTNSRYSQIVLHLYPYWDSCLCVFLIRIIYLQSVMDHLNCMYCSNPFNLGTQSKDYNVSNLETMNIE